MVALLSLLLQESGRLSEVRANTWALGLELRLAKPLVSYYTLEVRELFLPQCHWYGKMWKTSAYVETIGDGQVIC